MSHIAPAINFGYVSNMKLELQELALEKVAIPDLRRLKELSDRLQLSPKRESVLQWQSDIRELQSEGIYPTPEKTQRTADFLEDLGKREPTKRKSARRKLDVTSEDPERENDKVSPSVVDTESVPSIQITPTTANTNESQHETGVKLSARKKYFRQRSTEECQKRITNYALRLESESCSNELEDTTSDNKICDEKPSLTERYRRISLALERIRTDLLDMRIHDNTLARQLLDKRHELLQVKAVKTCDEHATMIDDFSFELEIEEELTEQLRSFDLPSKFLRGPNSLLVSTSPLRLIGISRMTLDSKRFSVI